MAGPPDPAALAWLPIVGIVVGGLAGTAAWATSLVAPGFTVAVAFGASLALTGAIHLDGFLDCCDALGASVPPERRRAILKDPHHGTFALAGLAIVVVPWLAALGQFAPDRLPASLAFAAGAARFAAVLNAYVWPYVGGGSPVAFAERPPVAVLAFAVLALAGVAIGAASPWWIVAGAGACVVSLGLGSIAARRLGGGLAGDVYGAAIVVLDVALLVVLACRHG